MRRLPDSTPSLLERRVAVEIRGVGSLVNPSRLTSHTHPASSLSVGEPDESIDWASVQEDLDIVCRTRANLLIIGPPRLTMNVVRQVIADVPATIVSPAGAGRLALPRLPLSPGIIVFRDIDALDPDNQASLFDWLEHPATERQIVCTASGPVLPLINAGAFDRELYYRLNTVSIRVGSPPVEHHNSLT